MEKYTYTGKNIDELKANAYQELNLEIYLHNIKKA